MYHSRSSIRHPHLAYPVQPNPSQSTQNTLSECDRDVDEDIMVDVTAAHIRCPVGKYCEPPDLGTAESEDEGE